jgi:hypothetical protein
MTQETFAQAQLLFNEIYRIKNEIEKVKKIMNAGFNISIIPDMGQSIQIDSSIFDTDTVLCAYFDRLCDALEEKEKALEAL